MPKFSVVIVEHGYATSQYERDVVSTGGGEFVDADNMPLERALSLCEQADGILVRRIEVTSELIQRFASCKVIARYGVGTDNIDIAAATKAGIFVVNVPGYSIHEVSDHAIALLLLCVRQLLPAHLSMRDGGWDLKRPFAVHRMHGHTLGLVGLGMIGRMTAAKMKPWGLRLLAVDPYVEPEIASQLGVELVDIQTLCKCSDYISIHAPLLPETYHLFGKAQFSMMKPDAVLVNTARGGLVDLNALRNALDAKELGRAALDVFETEPLPEDSPLRAHPKLVLSDHMAWYSEESQVELQTTAAEEVVRVCRGGLPHSLANPELIVEQQRQSEWKPGPSMAWQLKRLGITL